MLLGKNTVDTCCRFVVHLLVLFLCQRRALVVNDIILFAAHSLLRAIYSSIDSRWKYSCSQRLVELTFCFFLYFFSLQPIPWVCILSILHLTMVLSCNRLSTQTLILLSVFWSWRSSFSLVSFFFSQCPKDCVLVFLYNMTECTALTLCRFFVTQKPSSFVFLFKYSLAMQNLECKKWCMVITFLASQSICYFSILALS